MTVPGPGHVDQEIEMHKSLLKDAEKEESDLDSEVQSMLEEKFGAFNAVDALYFCCFHDSQAVFRARKRCHQALHVEGMRLLSS